MGQHPAVPPHAPQGGPQRQLAGPEVRHLNRSCPGDSDGYLTERLAYAIVENMQIAVEPFPDDLGQSSEFDPTEPEPIPDDDFDQTWDA